MCETVRRLFLPILLCIGFGFAQEPVNVWKKILPSDCYFVAAAGDSIIAVGKTITVWSQSGTMLSESTPLDATKSIVDTHKGPAFYLTNDYSLLMVVNRNVVNKVSLSGEVVWSKSFGDTLPGTMFNDLTEGPDGTIYLCGSVENRTGIIVKIDAEGTSVYRGDTTVPVYTSIAWVRDTLFVMAKHFNGILTLGSLVAFDGDGVFAGRLIDSGCGSPFLVDDEEVVSIGALDGRSVLSKKMFFQTADIILRRHTLEGVHDTTALFDFGKYEYPRSLQKYNGGVLMVTVSDETVNMGSNYLNYFITRLDASFTIGWQLHFGTDTLGLVPHFRCFSADAQGTILATHNDTLFMFSDASIGIRSRPVFSRVAGLTRADNIVKVFDCRGRLLFRGTNGKLFRGAAGIHVRTTGRSSVHGCDVRKIMHR